jgi:hypothetical protein
VVHPASDASERSDRVDVRDPVTFFVWKCSADRRLYLVTASETVPDNAPACATGHWRFVKSLREEGRARVGFSEAEAKRDIAKQGFHAVRIDVETQVRAHDETDER